SFMVILANQPPFFDCIRTPVSSFQFRVFVPGSAGTLETWTPKLLSDFHSRLPRRIELTGRILLLKKPVSSFKFSSFRCVGRLNLTYSKLETGNPLTLAVLEALTGAFLSVLLALLAPRIA